MPPSGRPPGSPFLADELLGRGSRRLGDHARAYHQSVVKGVNRSLAALIMLLLPVIAGCKAAQQTPSPSASISPEPSGSLFAVPTDLPDLGTTPRPCAAAAIDGVLLGDETSGFVLLESSGLVQVVIWPHGYVGRKTAAGRELVDGEGKVVARERDHVLLGGGEWPGQGWKACAGVVAILPSPSPSPTAVPGTLTARPMAGVHGGDEVFSLVVIDGMLAAIATHLHQGAIWTSNDGANWTLLTNTPTYPVGDGPNQLHRVVAGPGGFVATGGVYSIDWGTPRIWFSADGRKWDDVLGPTDPYQSLCGSIDGVASTDRGYVAVGGIYKENAIGIAQMWASNDGRAWRAIDSAGISEDSLTDVAAGNGLFVALGNTNGIGTSFVSTDGEHWTRAPDQASLEAAGLFRIVFEGGTFMASGLIAADTPAGSVPAFWRSTDGLAWTLVFRGPLGHRMPDFVASASGFVAIGYKLEMGPSDNPGYPTSTDGTIEMWTSVDGLAWRGPLLGYANGSVSGKVILLGDEILVPGSTGSRDGTDFKWVVFRGSVPPS